jgi:hypothetical protein
MGKAREIKEARRAKQEIQEFFQPSEVVKEEPKPTRAPKKPKKGK